MPGAGRRLKAGREGMDKIHLVITGRRNTGKSSLANKILGQSKAVVSPVPGTTTDPVKKSYEIPGIASVVLIDTAGIDDEGELGKLRIGKTFDAIQQADAAILVIAHNQFGEYEENLIRQFQLYHQPFVILHNRSDITPLDPQLAKNLKQKYHTEIIAFSALQDQREKLLAFFSKWLVFPEARPLLAGLIKPGQLVMLVTPIDSEAPTGRLILPQVQMLRAVLDQHALGIVLQPEEMDGYFHSGKAIPDLVITDSQVFGQVVAQIPEEIPLTSFSILLAHHKGNFKKYIIGTQKIGDLHDGDRILLLESCSHHTSCEDIGRVKIPALLRKYTSKQLEFDFVAGLDQIKRPFQEYALIIQCGGCMITATQLRHRLQPAIEAGIPVSNYGMTLAYLQGIFERATREMR